MPYMVIVWYKHDKQDAQNTAIKLFVKCRLYIFTIFAAILGAIDKTRIVKRIVRIVRIVDE
jgi:hypothetical protein